MPTPTGPSSNSHPKLHNSQKTVTYMFEPVEEGNVNVWESKGKNWHFVAIMKKDYARQFWNFHVSNGAFRVQD